MLPTSLSLRVMVSAAAAPIVAFTGFAKVRTMVSAFSTTASSTTGTVMVAEVAPAGMDTEPSFRR